MIKLNINHTEISASNLETLVEGNVKSIFTEFNFSAEWDGLARIAVFRNRETKVSVSLESAECAIPWEVLNAPGELFVSVRGLGDNGNFVICTENASLGAVVQSDAGTAAEGANDATPDVLDTLVAEMAEIRSGIGEVGHTPVKGVDYFTEEDKAEIVDEVENAMSSIFAAKDDLTDYQPKEIGKGLSSNDYNNAEKAKVADAYTDKHSHSNKEVLDCITAALIAAWNGKQDSLSDIDTIRSNASAGAAKVSCTDAAVGNFGYTKVTDSHINNLIDAKIGVIENGNY